MKDQLAFKCLSEFTISAPAACASLDNNQYTPAYTRTGNALEEWFVTCDILEAGALVHSARYLPSSIQDHRIAMLNEFP